MLSLKTISYEKRLAMIYGRDPARSTEWTWVKSHTEAYALIRGKKLYLELEYNDASARIYRSSLGKGLESS